MRKKWSLKFGNVQINIGHRGRMKQILARVDPSGTIAVHRTVGFRADGWSITHVPSGRAFTTGCDFQTARAYAKVMTSECLDEVKALRIENGELVPTEAKQKILDALEGFVSAAVVEGVLDYVRKNHPRLLEA